MSIHASSDNRCKCCHLPFPRPHMIDFKSVREVVLVATTSLGQSEPVREGLTIKLQMHRSVMMNVFDCAHWLVIKVPA